MQKPLIIVKACDEGDYAYVDIQLNWLLVRSVGLKWPEMKVEWPSVNYVIEEYIRRGAENAIRDAVRHHCEARRRAAVSA